MEYNAGNINLPLTYGLTLTTIVNTQILPGFRNNPSELARIADNIHYVADNKDIEIRSISLHGYASPEGSEALNARLAFQRAAALRDHLTQIYGIPFKQIHISSTAEDWKGLEALIEETRLNRKEDILRIICSDVNAAAKEQNLKALGAVWNPLLIEYFPSLRRVEYRIDYTIRHYNVEQARDLLNRNPELLSAYELYQVAMTYEEGSPQQEEIFRLTLRMYPDDPAARHNLDAIRRIRER